MNGIETAILLLSTIVGQLALFNLTDIFLYNMLFIFGSDIKSKDFLILISFEKKDSNWFWEIKSLLKADILRFFV